MSKMTDGQWRKLIERASAAYLKAEELQKRAEEEYELRYGHNPSEVDDDWWIDTIQGGGVNMAEIKRQAAEEACFRSRTTTTSSTKPTSVNKR